MIEPDVLLTATEAAELLGVGRTHIHDLVKHGRLLAFLRPIEGETKGVKRGHLYIPRGEVLALKERREGRRGCGTASDARNSTDA